MLSLLWASVCQMIRIIANVTFAIMIISSLNGCWWLDITFGFVILIFSWGFAQVRTFVRCRRRITILKTTIVVRMIRMRSSLFARGSSAMFAKRNFSFIFYIAGFTVRSRFEIRSVCSLAFLLERSVLFFFLSEEAKFSANFCLSDLPELCCFSFGLAKDGGSRPSCLVCWFRYCMIALSGL